MPLIIITGLPCSGKTFRAIQISEDFQSRIENIKHTPTNKSTVLLPSHHASLDPRSSSFETYTPPDRSSNLRDHIYNSTAAEKTARAEEFSAIKRAVSKNAIVIADAPNYIKGFRYQLWCEAKATGTRCVVIHTAAREDECKHWNNERLKAWDWYCEETTQPEPLSRTSGPNIGKDVLGDLMPESHTALYGDRVLTNGTRSRSSSTGAAASDDGNGSEQHPADRHPRAEDTMTLKSLYISDETSQSMRSHLPQANKTAEPKNSSEATSFASSTPPTAKSSLPYSPNTFTSLAMRYEPPSPFSRWDTPLFTIPSNDPHPPYDAIWDALFPAPSKQMSKKALSQQAQSQVKAASQQGSNGTSEAATKFQQIEDVKQHAATVLPAAIGADALQNLEHATGDVVKAILATARDRGLADGSGGEITFSVPGTIVNGKMAGVSDAEGAAPIETAIGLPMGTMISQPMLQRLRRKYTQIQRGGIAHGQGYVRGREEVVDGFIRFLEREWDV